MPCLPHVNESVAVRFGPLGIGGRPQASKPRGRRCRKCKARLSETTEWRGECFLCAPPIKRGNSVERAILSRMRKFGPLSVQQLWGEIDCSLDCISAAVRRMAKDGDVREVKATRPKTWEATSGKRKR